MKKRRKKRGRKVPRKRKRRKVKKSKKRKSTGRKQKEESLLSILGGLALDVVKGLGAIVSEAVKAGRSERKHRKYEISEVRYDLREAIAEEGHRRGLEGEPPAYVVRYAEDLLESEDVDFEKVVEEAVDYWEETEAYRRTMD